MNESTNIYIETALCNLGQAARQMAKTISNNFRVAFVKNFAPNKRVAHLALYAKKERVRKKNLNRVKKEFVKMLHNVRLRIKEREK